MNMYNAILFVRIIGIIPQLNNPPSHPPKVTWPWADWPWPLVLLICHRWWGGESWGVCHFCDEEMERCWNHQNCLVVSNMAGLFSIHTWVVILPIDELICFKMVKSTSQKTSSHQVRICRRFLRCRMFGDHLEHCNMSGIQSCWIVGMWTFSASGLNLYNDVYVVHCGTSTSAHDIESQRFCPKKKMVVITQTLASMVGSPCRHAVFFQRPQRKDTERTGVLFLHCNHWLHWRHW